MDLRGQEGCYCCGLSLMKVMVPGMGVQRGGGGWPVGDCRGRKEGLRMNLEDLIFKG